MKTKDWSTAEPCPVMKTASVKPKSKWARIGKVGNLFPSLQGTPPSRVLAPHPRAPPPPPPPPSCLAHSRPLPRPWAQPPPVPSQASDFWCPCRGPGAPPANKWRGRTRRHIAEVRWKEMRRKGVDMSVLPMQGFWAYRQWLLDLLFSDHPLSYYPPALCSWCCASLLSVCSGPSVAKRSRDFKLPDSKGKYTV